MPMMTLPQGQVHYRKMGEGDKYVVLLHASPGDSKDYDAVIAPLKQHCCVITLDWPGYGKSDQPNPPELASGDFYYQVLKDFLAELAVERMVLIGNSVGGYAAARYAIDYPEKVKGLILVSPAGFTRHNVLTRFFCKLQASACAIPPGVLARWYLRGDGLVVHDVLKRAKNQHSEPSAKGIMRHVWRSMLTLEQDLLSSAQKISAPSLLLFGQYDPLTPAATDGKNAHSVIPHGELIVSSSGHMVFAEAPEYFLAIALKFLRKVYGL